VNAISDSQPIDATIENVPTNLNNIGFADASGFQDVPEGSYKVQLSTNYNGSNVQFTANNVSVDHNNQTTVFAVGNLSAGNQNALVVEDQVANVDSSQTQVQFVDVAGAGGSIYLVTPGTTDLSPGSSGVIASATLLDPQTALATDPTKAYSTPTPIAAGTYELIVTTAGGVKIFDSGSSGGVSLQGGTTERFVVFNATDISNGSAIQVLELDSHGNKTPIPAAAP
jgi:hypothetical protein